MTDGRLNLVDPAEYLSSAPMADRTWRFAETRLSDALAFAAYRPYHWIAPLWMRAAIAISLAAFTVSVFIMVAYGFSRRPLPRTPYNR